MDQIEIAIGTYENLILGYRLEQNVSDQKKKQPIDNETETQDDGDWVVRRKAREENFKAFTLESSFTTDSHCGALRCLSVSPQGVLASSSTDDSIRLHNLKKRKEVGSLFQHDGSVNCIRFFKGGHMFSASEDGTICLWKCKNWELLRVLKGHGCHVMAVTVHPSGKLALSIGNDRTFFTWDMTTGKLAFKRKLDEAAQDLLFTHDGNHYVLVYQKRMEVCSLEDTEVVQEIKYDSRINVVCFVKENILAVGGDDGNITILDVMSNTQLAHKTFQGRVRSLSILGTTMGDLLFVASTSGSIRVCKLDLTENDGEFETLVDYNSGTRLTCMTVYAPSEILRPEEEAEEKVDVQRDVKDRQKKAKKARDMADNSRGEEEDDAPVEEEGDCDVEDTDQSDDEADQGNSPEEDSPEEIEPKPKKRKVAKSPPAFKKKAKKGKLETPTKEEKTKKRVKKSKGSEDAVSQPSKKRKTS